MVYCTASGIFQIGCLQVVIFTVNDHVRRIYADLEQLLGEGSLEHMFASNASQMRSLHVAEEDDGSGQPCTLSEVPARAPAFGMHPRCCSECAR